MAAALMILAAAPTLAQSEKNTETDKPECCAAHKVEKCCAQDKAVENTKACCKHGMAAGCGDTNCAGDLVRFKGLALPRILYQVNDERLSCPKSAVKMAKAENADLKYVVADKVFTNKPEAFKAHAELLDEFLGDMLTVKYAVGENCVACPDAAEAIAKKEGKKVRYRLASFDFEDRASAEKATKLASEASEQVELKMVVGDETFDCPMHAAEAAKKQGKEVDYCIGKLKTASEADAMIELAVERIKAALTAFEKCGGKQIAGA